MSDSDVDFSAVAVVESAEAPPLDSAIVPPVREPDIDGVGVQAREHAGVPVDVGY